MTTDERRIINKIHKFMAYKNTLITDKQGNKIPNVDYKKIPYQASILLFGGYKTIGFHAADAIKAYYAEYKEWPNLIITGKSSNKFDNTAGLGSEVNAYQYILENCGIPKNVVRKYYIPPQDTSTAENIQSVDKILNLYPELKERPIVLFTQSYYMRRAVHDFAQNLSDMRLIAANLPPADFDNGLFYNDRADGNAIDVMMGACFYQSMYNQNRWEKGETLAPTAKELSLIPKKQEITPIIAQYCGWLYPNNLMDLGLADDLTGAKKMIEERKAKIFENPAFEATQQQKDIINAVRVYRLNHGICRVKTSKEI